MGRHEAPEPKWEQPTEEEYRAARIALDEHLIMGTGRCRSCKAFGPCSYRNAAIRVISRASWLPMRTPGLTRPELLGAKQIA